MDINSTSNSNIFLATFFIVAKAKVVCRHAITAKVSQQKLQSFTAKATVVTQSPQKFHNRSCKVSQQKQQSYVVTQSPQKFHNRSCKVSQQKQQSSRNHRKRFTTEAAKFHSKSNSRHAITAKVSQQKLQSFTANATVLRRNAITAKVSQQKLQSFTAKATVVTQSPQKFHNGSCKVSQQKQQSYVVTQSPQKFHSKSNSRKAITAKVSQQKPQSFAAKAITGSCKTVIGNGTTTVKILYCLFQNVSLRNDRKSHPIVSLQGLVASS